MSHNTMARLGRKGRILKWAGLVASLSLGLPWALSQVWSFHYSREWWEPIGDGPEGLPIYVRLHIEDGGIYCRHGCGPEGTKWSVSRNQRLPEIAIRPSEWVPRFARVKSGAKRGAYETSVDLPLFLPFTTVAVVTGFLWYRDRRRIPPGHCQKCGYNLTGNVSGVCPECGENTYSHCVPDHENQT
jgi:hypothetical protein